VLDIDDHAFTFDFELNSVSVLSPPAIGNDSDQLSFGYEDRVLCLREIDFELRDLCVDPCEQVILFLAWNVSNTELQILSCLSRLLTRFSRRNDNSDPNLLIDSVIGLDLVVGNYKHGRAVPLAAIVSEVGIQEVTVTCTLPSKAQAIGVVTIGASISGVPEARTFGVENQIFASADVDHAIWTVNLHVDIDLFCESQRVDHIHIRDRI